MKKQFLLASVSVLAALVAASAHAEDLNTTNINQTGNNGQVTITQSGNSNTAGTATSSISDSLVQAGTANALTVTQSGDSNIFKGATPVNVTPGSVVQSGTNNTANVTQSGTSSTAPEVSCSRTAGIVTDANCGGALTI